MTLRALWRHHRGRVIAAIAGLVALLSLPWVPSTTLPDGRAAGGAALAAPIIAIVLALVTRRLFLSLGSAVVVGALLHHGGVRGIPRGLRKYAWENALEPSHLYIIGFTLALLGMVQVTARSGGARGIVEAVARWVRSARGTKLGTFAMGVLVFFDDYANCMLVGPTMRPFADRYRVSREKLAYIVDSTAAPISGIVLISTWVGYEAGLLGDVAKTLGLPVSGYALLFSALPFRFYCVLTLVFVFLTSFFERDFGPMLAAERRAAEHGKLLRDGASPLGGGSDERHAQPPAGAPLYWINAALPVGAVVLGTLGGLVVDGRGWPKLAVNPLSLLHFSFWRKTLSASENNTQVLFVAALSGAVLAIVLPVGQRVLSARQSLVAFGRGVKGGMTAVAVLLLAWALAAVCKDLGAGPVLIAAVGKSLPTVLVPVVTFGVAAAVAFATGTSWGTMAILIPTAVPLAHATGSEPLTLLTMASVLDGAIFGDHCSPISDTTLMSSIAAGSDHVDHVATQLPYAVTAMLAAMFGGYLPVAFGWPPAAAYAMGIAMVALAVFGLGRKVRP